MSESFSFTSGSDLKGDRKVKVCEASYCDAFMAEIRRRQLVAEGIKVSAEWAPRYAYVTLSWEEPVC